MKNTKVLAIIMALALCLTAMAALSIGSSAENVNVAEGKTVTAGNGQSPTGLTDGSTAGYFDLGWWSDTNEGTPYGLEGTCYVEIDLGADTEIGAINVVNLVDSGRIYKWEAYATTDNTADISTWTKIGEKTNDDVSTAKGTTVTFEKMTARYVRVYGTYHNQNVGYHLAEVTVLDEYKEKELTWPDTMTISPAFVGGTGLENWRGNSVLIFAPSMYNEDLATVGAKITEGTYAVKFVVKDETTGDVYTISKYAFDHVDEGWKAFEIDTTNGIFRLVASDYQIPLTADHTYSITGEVTENGELKYNIVMAEGKVFTALESNLNPANGPAEGFQAPHEYDELNPDVPVDPPVDPVDPPVTGDATAIIAVLAVVALFGAAVVTKKVFVK